eukprot:6070757-Pyramimonas_sp.AAC.1
MRLSIQSEGRRWLGSSIALKVPRISSRRKGQSTLAISAVIPLSSPDLPFRISWIASLNSSSVKSGTRSPPRISQEDALLPCLEVEC